MQDELARILASKRTTRGGKAVSRDIRVEQIDNAIVEAKRFIRKAELWARLLGNDRFAYISGSTEGGACKRASMDLTRALVPLRKTTPNA